MYEIIGKNLYFHRKKTAYSCVSWNLYAYMYLIIMTN